VTIDQEADDMSGHPGATSAQMLSRVTELMVAKQAHDVDTLLSLYHPEIVLEQASLGFTSQGYDALRTGLELWAQVFPDYERDFEGATIEGNLLVSWGTARVTLTGEFGGYKTNGNRAEVMTLVIFRFLEGLIVYEGHHWDIATVCHASGIPVEAVKPMP